MSYTTWSVTQVQLDELFALLSAVKAGEVSDADGSQRLSRSPHWVWAAIDPVTKLLLAIDVGERTLAMAQRVVHQVVSGVGAWLCPLFLTDGLKEYMTALLTHFGHWVQPPRRQAKGASPKPRWMPLPQLLYAQGVKQYRRRRVVRVRHRVVFGTLGGGPAACWPPTAGRSTRRSLSASTSASVSMWRRWGDASPRCANTRRACASSWQYIRSITISVCPMPAYACPYRSLSRPTARARPSGGGPGHRRWWPD